MGRTGRLSPAGAHHPVQYRGQKGLCYLLAQVITNGGKRLDLASVMAELEALGTEQTRKTYRNHGAREPSFGVTLRDMKPLAKKIKKDHALAMELYATGNYDAQTLAGKPL